LFVVAEEQQTLGSKYYAEHPSVAAGRIAASFLTAATSTAATRSRSPCRPGLSRKRTRCLRGSPATNLRRPANGPWLRWGLNYPTPIRANGGSREKSCEDRGTLRRAHHFAAWAPSM
jgi:hypothetical protein